VLPLFHCTPCKRFGIYFSWKICLIRRWRCLTLLRHLLRLLRVSGCSAPSSTPITSDNICQDR
jgi:hypothetical protein